MYKQYMEKKDQLKHVTKNSILEKYGGEEHLDAPPKEMLLAQTEDYVEYSRTGQILKGQEKAIPKTRFAEDGRFLNDPPPTPDIPISRTPNATSLPPQPYVRLGFLLGSGAMGLQMLSQFCPKFVLHGCGRDSCQEASSQPDGSDTGRATHDHDARPSPKDPTRGTDP